MSKQYLKVFIMTVIVMAFLALIGTTYAYYQVKIIENKAEKSISAKTQVLSIEYIEGNGQFSGSTDGYVFPGESFTKTFTIKNTGEAKARYHIILKNVVNTFTRTQDWTYILKEGENIITNTTIFPTEPTSIISPILEIEKDKSVTYTLTINYLESTENQLIDANQEISATIDVEGIK